MKLFEMPFDKTAMFVDEKEFSGGKQDRRDDANRLNMHLFNVYDISSLPNVYIYLLVQFNRINMR